MKLGPKAGYCILSALCGIFSSLFFLSFFDVYTMKVFHQTSKHPIEYPSMLIVSAVSFFSALLSLIVDITVISKAERKGRIITAAFCVFMVCLFLSFFIWSFIIWLFDSDAGIIS